MNERIRELAVAAAPANSSIPHSEWNIPKEFMDKFAELIVRECADIAKHHAMNISTYSDAEFVENQIREHFGVEA